MNRGVTTRRRTTRKRTTTTRRVAPPPEPPVAGPGERIWVLTVPYPERALASIYGARWNAAVRATVYVGAQLPAGLTPYQSEPYSWDRWIEDDLNRSRMPVMPTAATMVPRPHQETAINAITAAGKRAQRGFLEADDVGVGKTISGWQGAVAVAVERGATNVLILCPKGVIPHWRRTVSALGDRGLRVCVINYDQTKRLLSIPESAATAVRTRTKNKRIATSGKPLVNWDLVIMDESHKLKNPTQRTAAVSKIARYAAPASTAPFLIWMSATAGQNPVELSYLAPLFAELTGTPGSDLKDFGGWLESEGFVVTYNERFEKWEWGVIPEEASGDEIAQIEAGKRRDLRRIQQMLFEGPTAPAIRRLPTDIAGWPEIQRILHPVALTADERRLYEQAWRDFRAELNLARKQKDSSKGMVARLRFRQKSSFLRVPGTVEQIEELLDNGHQVVVSVEFMESLDAIREALEKQKITVSEWTGRNPDDREQQRLKFQRGGSQVMLFSVEEGISLHANELLPDGSKASSTPRSCIVHDPRYSGIASIQIEGRAHRDGELANVYYTFGENTAEETVIRSLVERVLSTKEMLGDDTTTIRLLEQALDKAAA